MLAQNRTRLLRVSVAPHSEYYFPFWCVRALHIITRRREHLFGAPRKYYGSVFNSLCFNPFQSIRRALTYYNIIIIIILLSSSHPRAQTHSHRWRSNEQQPRNKVIEPSYHRIGRANRILFSESSPTIGNGREDPPANLFR